MSSNIAANLDHIVLPRFPKIIVDKEQLDSFSDELIKAYSRLRITCPEPPISILVKRIPVILPTLVGDATEIHSNLIDTDECTAVVMSPSESSAERVAVSVLEPVSESPAQGPPAQKCFLHAKQKPSCKRCQSYLEFKRSEDSGSKRSKT